MEILFPSSSSLERAALTVAPSTCASRSAAAGRIPSRSIQQALSAELIVISIK
jgi:hypothetical protein